MQIERDGWHQVRERESQLRTLYPCGAICQQNKVSALGYAQKKMTAQILRRHLLQPLRLLSLAMNYERLLSNFVLTEEESWRPLLNLYSYSKPECGVDKFTYEIFVILDFTECEISYIQASSSHASFCFHFLRVCLSTKVNQQCQKYYI